MKRGVCCMTLWDQERTVLTLYWIPWRRSHSVHVSKRSPIGEPACIRWRRAVGACSAAERGISASAHAAGSRGPRPGPPGASRAWGMVPDSGLIQGCCFQRRQQRHQDRYRQFLMATYDVQWILWSRDGKYIHALSESLARKVFALQSFL